MHQHNQLELFCEIPKETRQFADFLHFDGFSFKITEDNTNGMSILKDRHPFCTCKIRLSPIRPYRYARLRTLRREK